MGTMTCRNGHTRTEANTVVRNGFKVCLDCEKDRRVKPLARRQKPRNASGGSAVKRTRKTRGRSVSDRRGGEHISTTEAVKRIVFEGIPVSTAARMAGKARHTVKDAAWEFVKRVVRGRDGQQCRKCRQRGSNLDVHHRKLKQMGGSDAVTEFGLANLVALCRECHGVVHGLPDLAVELGLIVPQHEEPAEVPIRVGRVPILLDYQGRAKRGGDTTWSRRS